MILERKDWKEIQLQGDFYAIEGHYWPKMARVVLLDDTKGVVYEPVGTEAYDIIMYWKYPYPVSHTCAVEEENLGEKRGVVRVFCPKCGKPFGGVGVKPGTIPPPCRRCHGENTA